MMEGGGEGKNFRSQTETTGGSASNNGPINIRRFSADMVDERAESMNSQMIGAVQSIMSRNSKGDAR